MVNQHHVAVTALSAHNRPIRDSVLIQALGNRIFYKLINHTLSMQFVNGQRQKAFIQSASIMLNALVAAI